MTGLFDWFNRNKTYVIAAIVGIQAGVEYLGYPIPDWVVMIEAALGLSAVRHSIRKIEINQRKLMSLRGIEKE